MEKESGTLEELLNVRVVLELKKLARLLTGVKLPTRKADIIAIIVREMTEYTRDYWDILDDLQQKAVAEALYAPWFDEGGFYAKYGAEPDWGDTPSWSEYTHEPSLLHLFIMSGDRYGYYGGQKVVPDDLKVILKKFVPKPPPAKLRVETKRPESVEVPQYNFLTGKEKIKQIPLYHADTERTAQEDLMSVLRLVDAGKVRVSERTGRPSAATVRIIGEALWGGDFYPDREKRDKWEELPGPIKAHAWPMLIHAAKLARLKSGKLQLTPAGRKAFDAPPHETIKTLWRAWLKNAKTDELQRVNAIRGQTTVDGKSGMTSTVKRRDVIVKALKKCPVEKWFGFGDFFDFMRASNYLLIVSNEPWALFIQDEYGHLTDGWALLASQYTQVFLFEYAATLGLIDVAYIDPVDSPDGDYEADIAFLSRYDGLMCLRINALGAFCLGRKRSYTPSEVEIERVLKVLPNFDVVAFKPLPSGDQIALEQFAEKTADNVWKIRPEQMLKGLESGQSLDHMRSFLKHKSGEALPQPVAVLFDDMADKVPRLRAKGTAHLIEVTDVETAQFLAHDQGVSKYCYLAGDRQLVVPEKSLTAFRNALRKVGYILPK